MACTQCMLFTDGKLDTQNRWFISVLEPNTTTGTSDRFVYQLDKNTNNPDLIRDISNLVICLCIDSQGVNLANLINVSESGWIFNDTTDEFGEPFVAVTASGNPGQGSALPCVPQVKFEEFPDDEMNKLELILVFNEPVNIGAVQMGYTAGSEQSGTLQEGQWLENNNPIVCGPCCTGISPPTRGILLDI